MNTKFETSTSGKNEWLTPPYILGALGVFDLDPCSPINRPWDTARRHYTVLDDGLAQEWHGRVWCNPPYGTNTVDWLKKCSRHGDATAMTFARTETKMFFESVWDMADAILFLRSRPRFYHVTGEICMTNMPGAPSVLIAYGQNNSEILQQCGIAGKFISLR